MLQQSFSDIVKSRRSTRSFDTRPVPKQLLREILSSGQWAPYSCNLQSTQCIVVDDPELLQRLKKDADPKFGWAPCVIVMMADTRIGNARSASDVSLGGIMQTVLLTATERGLATCPMAGFRGDDAVRRILDIPDFMKIRLLIGVGYPSAENSKKRKEGSRISFDRFVSWNRSEQEFGFKEISANVDRWRMSDLIDYRERLAPVYLYEGHNRLQNFSDEVFRMTVDRCLDLLPEDSCAILDLCSYDGLAIRLLSESRNVDRCMASDHVSYVGEMLLANRCCSDFVRIASDHRINLPDASCDVVTCFHKLEFTPDWESLLKEAVRVLRPGGMLYVSTMQPSYFRFVFDLIRYRFKSPGFRLTMYDGNPYYKIGPFQRRSFQKIRSSLMGFNLTCTASGTDRVKIVSGFDHVFAWASFKKIQ